jgi:hypothetical protein
MNRVQIPLLKHLPSNQLVDGTCELPGQTVNVTMSLAFSRSKKHSGGLKAKPQRGCRSVAVHPKHLVVSRPDRRSSTSFPRLGLRKKAGNAPQRCHASRSFRLVVDEVSDAGCSSRRLEPPFARRFIASLRIAGATGSTERCPVTGVVMQRTNGICPTRSG